MAQTVKHLSAMQETGVRSLGGEDPLEEDMATYSSVLAWRIPWTVGSSIYEVSRQEYWSGLPFFPPKDLPNPGIEPQSPALKVDSLPTELPVPWIKYWLKATICKLNISLFLSFTITILLF